MVATPNHSRSHAKSRQWVSPTWFPVPSRRARRNGRRRERKGVINTHWGHEVLEHALIEKICD
jgi:hypothetical protein